MLVSRGGMVVRTKVNDIRSTGRDAAGVTIIDLSGDDQLTGVARGEGLESDDSEAGRFGSQWHGG